MKRVLIVDASVVVDLIARFEPQPIEKLIWADDVVLAAPEIMDVEVLQALRRLERIGAIPEGRRNEIARTLGALKVRRYRHRSLLDAIWRYRHNLTAYDTAYVALARALSGLLVTRDTRLAASSRLDVDVTVP